MGVNEAFHFHLLHSGSTATRTCDGPPDPRGNCFRHAPDLRVTSGLGHLDSGGGSDLGRNERLAFQRGVSRNGWPARPTSWSALGITTAWIYPWPCLAGRSPGGWLD